LHSCNVKTQICVTRPQCVNLSSRALGHGVSNYAHEIIVDVCVNRDAFSVFRNLQ